MQKFQVTPYVFKFGIQVTNLSNILTFIQDFFFHFSFHHRFVTGTERWIWLFSSYDIIHQSLIRNGFCVWEAVEGN